MTEVKIPVRIRGTRRCTDIPDALVDTGAIHSWISQALAAEVGLEVEEVLDVEQMDGPPFQANAGTLKMTINGVERGVPVAVSEKDVTIIGVTALETMGFAVDPMTGRLTRKRRRAPSPRV